MNKLCTLCLVSIALLMESCQGNTKTSDPQGEKKEADTVKSEPDNADLLKVLQGKWQSEQDPNYVVEIIGNRMLHQNNGQPTLETSIEADATCINAACKMEGVDTSDGWCFIESSKDTQCNLVLKCDTNLLHYRALGATGDLMFKKVN